MSASVSSLSRRDFLAVSGTSFAAVGTALALWPFASQLAPDASTLALANTEVDLGGIAEGGAVTVKWRGRPVFIRRRTPDEIAAARAVLPAELKDKSARNAALPDDALATDENRVKAGKEQWLVLLGSCTHLGCVPQGQGRMEKRGAYGGWFCSCHGSQYDTSGRIRQGPAPENLAVPPYYFDSGSSIVIGLTSRPKPVETRSG